MTTFVKIFSGNCHEIEEEINDYAKNNNCYAISASITETKYSISRVVVVFCYNKVHEH